MAKKDYVDPNDNGFGLQQTTFKNSIGGYNALLDVTGAQVTAQAADCDYFNYTLACNDITQNDAKQWTAWKNLLRNGSSLPPGGPPVAPVLPAAVPAVLPGVETRFRALAKAIKTHVNYNDAIGQALGIEGVVITGPDLSVVQPIISLSINGGRVDIKWGWGGNQAFLDMLEIEVDRADGKGFVLLAFDTTPNYVDTTPFPAAATKWSYRAIYHVGDERVGIWSDTATIMVGG